MKTDNQNNYRLVNAVFMKFCEKNSLTLFNNSVCFEHEGFSCTAEDSDGNIKQFRAVDAACPYCSDSDYCFNCERYNQIDFEEIS